MAPADADPRHHTRGCLRRGVVGFGAWWRSPTSRS